MILLTKTLHGAWSVIQVIGVIGMLLFGWAIMDMIVRVALLVPGIIIAVVAALFGL